MKVAVACALMVLAASLGCPRPASAEPVAGVPGAGDGRVAARWPVRLPASGGEQVAHAAHAALGSRHLHQPRGARAEVVIDVIVAYTRKAARHYHDLPRDLIDLSVEITNISFRASNIGHVRLRVAHAYATDYDETGASHFDHVWRLADKGDGYLDEVHALRDLHRADVGILVVDDAQGCGLATRVGASAEEAFAVVHHACAAASYTLAHEIGHLIGARHELGFVSGSKWRDIMATKESCGGCPRIPVWSSPAVLVAGEPAATPLLGNARIIAEGAARVAAFRN